MDESEKTDRRTFLKYAGTAATGATLSTAGCVGGDDDDNQSENGGDNGGENGMDNGVQSVTVTQGSFPETSTR